MIKLFKKKENFVAPVSGKLINVTEVKDEVFSKKLMGDGFAIIPADGSLYAPLSGAISFCFPTKHAFGITTTDGIEILIHMGVDTVELKGEGFESYVSEGQNVKQGDKLAIMDLDAIKAKGYDYTVMIIFPERIVELHENPGNVEHHQEIALKFK